MRLFFAVALVLALAACAGPSGIQSVSVNLLEANYQPVPVKKGVTLQFLANGEEPCVANAATGWADDSQRMLDAFFARGYAQIGSSLAPASTAINHRELAIAQAKNVKAGCVLILPPKQIDAQTWALGAVFFALRTDDRAFRPYGWVFADLTPEQRDAQTRKSGAFVRYVLVGSPAFRASVLPGDIIVKFEGNDIFSDDGLMLATQQAFEEDRVLIVVDRQGKEIEIPLRIEPWKLPGMSDADADWYRELRELRDLGILSVDEYRQKREARLRRQ